MLDPRPAVALRLRPLLVSAANPGGGWPYYAGKSSRIEPTAWALLALDGAPDGVWADVAAPHLQFLASCQRADGLLIDPAQRLPNFTANGLAACALAHVGGSEPVLGRLLAALTSVKGVALDSPDPRQNYKLQGWPWVPDTFSWIEPTSWCLLALKKSAEMRGGAGKSRIEEAEKLIVNRTAAGGGWNFGNAAVLDQDLRAYVPTTALALIALQDRRSDPDVARSVAYLIGARLSEPSAMALSLTVLCLRLYGQPADDVEERLAADADRAERVGNLQSLAMMLFALTASEHQAKAFHVA